MKTFIKSAFLTAVTFLSTSALADLPGMNRALNLQNHLSPALESMTDVNGNGIGACDAKTGRDDYNQPSDRVACLHITTVTEAAAKALRVLYPVGKKVNGVYISVEKIGEISAEPRLTSGN